MSSKLCGGGRIFLIYGKVQKYVEIRSLPLSQREWWIEGVTGVLLHTFCRSGTELHRSMKWLNSFITFRKHRLNRMPVTTENKVTKKVEADEFGGPIGAAFLIAWSHYILIYFW